MIRQLLLVMIILLSSFNLYGQNKLLEILPLDNGTVTYSEIVQAPGIDKDKLYFLAKKCFVNDYKSAKDVIQLDDPENGEIIGKGNFSILYFVRDPLISHTISIKVKDGRYKYSISNLSYSDVQGSSFTIENFPKHWAARKKLYRKVHMRISMTIISLKESMKINPEEDDW